MNVPDERKTPLEALREARLVSVRFIAADGYPSVAMRSNDAAAQVALDALTEAGYQIVRKDAVIMSHGPITESTLDYTGVFDYEEDDDG